ncbi:Uncharacterized membrane protein [Rhodovulum sp. ES.010]|uniref:periplasmic heavy metal sensor n=1 Tax=Rhodovulum sp. ES.010 TaxID=1882821 RepID=UPI00092840E5|nr:periplasmic heavy metal sensor [Rhodovulum sp. ES.010]SIO57302.1 Uncharacterized membrane protein [Rhodovulum sp. ES.010]
MSVAETDKTGAAPRTRAWVRIALVASLALNLLVLGMIGGAMLGHRHDGPRGASFGPGELGPYGRAFSAPDRDALRAALRAEAPRLRANREGVRAGFRDVLAALRAEPFDQARVEAALQAQQARLRDQMGLTRRLMLERVAAMSPEERSAFADRLEEVLRRGPPRDRGHRGP